MFALEDAVAGEVVFFIVDQCLDVIVNLVRLIEVFIVDRDRIPEVIVQGFLVIDTFEDIAPDVFESSRTDRATVSGGVVVHVQG